MAEKNKGGRPTKYRPEYPDLAFRACLLATTGVTDAGLAEFFDVDEATINRWKHDHPEFCESLKNGKDVADANVADALYQRALGYSHPEEKIFQNNGDIIRADTVKHYPPDTAAAFIWLKNRAGWKDRTEVTGKDGGPIDVDFGGLTLSQLERIASGEKPVDVVGGDSGSG